ncbi:MAG: magnesium/cobalt transporter CorA [Bacteroidales bacterium]|nr:magnesium/cobalt transporter CorA [Bacteroidales bacterium]
MARFFRQRTGMRGARPGTLLLIGDKKTEKVHISVMQFDHANLVEQEVADLDEALDMINDRTFSWINIYGIHDTEMISRLGQRLGIESLLLENILNTDHRPKFIAEEKLLVFITKLVTNDKESGQLQSDQLSIIAGDNFLLTLQERPGRHFDPVRQRIRASRDRTRINHSDYLAYALLDCVVDGYMDIIGELGNSIDTLEVEILDYSVRDTSEKIYRHRTEINFLRRIILPMKELTFNFLKSDSPIISDGTRIYMADLNEHILITHESIELYYNLVADQRDIHNSMISNRSNEIMQVLTVFAAFFIPLTFIAGIYGMNFEYIPELGLKNGYLYFWILVIVVAAVLTLYFRRKKWF